MDSESPDQTANAQADLGLCCPHVHDDMFLHGAAYDVAITQQITSCHNIKLTTRYITVVTGVKRPHAIRENVFFFFFFFFFFFLCGGGVGGCGGWWGEVQLLRS